MMLLLGCAVLLAGSDCDDADPKAPTAVADAGPAAPAPVADAGKETPVPKVEVEVGEATVTDTKPEKDKKPKK